MFAKINLISNIMKNTLEYSVSLDFYTYGMDVYNSLFMQFNAKRTVKKSYPFLFIRWLLPTSVHLCLIIADSDLFLFMGTHSFCFMGYTA